MKRLAIISLAFIMFMSSFIMNTGSFVKAAEVEITPTIINVDPSKELGEINPSVYGVNQRWFNDGNTMWIPEKTENGITTPGYVDPTFIENYNEIGVKSFRYPGGTVGNMFNWKNSIGPVSQRKNNVNKESPDFPSFGLDEAARFCESTGSEMIYVYAYGIGNAQDAADLVEYLNAPIDTNPNGGIAWAKVRAENGHPKPYNIKRFEIGNEADNAMNQGYWRNDDAVVAGNNNLNFKYAERYCFGGDMKYTKSVTVLVDDWRPNTSISDGAANQIKYVQFPQVKSGTAKVYADDEEWTLVRDLKQYGNEKVCTLDEVTGKISFGDEVNGSIPASGKKITVSYEAYHDGFTQYYKAMKSADTNIKIYSCIPAPIFIELMGKEHPYDGVSEHTYNNGLAIPLNITAASPITEYHHYVMQESDITKHLYKSVIEEMQKSVSPERAEGMELLCTEYGILIEAGRMDDKKYPNFNASLDAVLYNTMHLMNLIDLGVPVGSKHDLLEPGSAGLLNIGPTYSKNGTAYAFELFNKMFGNTRIKSEIIGNPVRSIENEKAIYTKLVSTTSKDKDGNVYLMVVNRDLSDDVVAEVQVDNFNLTDKILKTTTLRGKEFYSTNGIGLTDKDYPVNGSKFNYRFPALSVTAIKLNGNSKVPSTKMELNKHNINFALNKPVTTSTDAEGDPNKITDGSCFYNDRWYSQVNLNDWVMVDLGTAFSMDSYTIISRPYYFRDQAESISEYIIQVSLDGENWIDVDSVKSNRKKYLFRTVPEFKARYVRINIIDPNAPGNKTPNINLLEFELSNSKEDNKAPVWSESTKFITITDATETGVVKLNWDFASDNVGVQSYIVMQDGVEIAKVAANINNYTIKGLKPSRFYSIKVEAVDPAGNITKDGPYKFVKIKKQQRYLKDYIKF